MKKLIKDSKEISLYDMEGSVAHAVEFLMDWERSLEEFGWEDIKIEISYAPYEDSLGLLISGKRRETEKEEKKRLKLEEKEKETQRKKEKKEYANYLKLKKKYEDK
jgi:hypothetical protein